MLDRRKALKCVGLAPLVVLLAACGPEPRRERPAPQPATEVPAGQPLDDPNAPPASFVPPAATTAPVASPIAVARWGNYEVRLRRARVDHVVVTKLYTDEQVRTEDRMLILNLEVENLNEALKGQYITWGYVLELAHRPQADLDLLAGRAHDELGNTYERARWNDARIAGMRRAESLYAGKPIREVLVFEPPVKKAERITVTLPGNNFGKETKDVLTLTIPASAIEGR